VAYHATPRNPNRNTSNIAVVDCQCVHDDFFLLHQQTKDSKMKAFLPQDTSSIDVMSFGYLIAMIVGLLSVDIVFPFNNLLTKEFWLLILTSLSIISLMNIMLNKMTPVRILLQWFLGMIFTYLALGRISVTFTPTDSASLIIGLSNFYASAINTNLLLEDFTHAWSTNNPMDNRPQNRNSNRGNWRFVGTRHILR